MTAPTDARPTRSNVGSPARILAMLALLLFVGVIVAGMVATVIVVALRRPAQASTLLPGEIPQPSAALLQMWRKYPDCTLEYNEDSQQWSLVAADGRYMLESEIVQASPRRITQR